MNNSYNICVKPLQLITGKRVNPTASMVQKQKALAKCLNQSKYEFLGFVDRTTDVVLRPLYHNIRDNQGRFASVK